ncbi:MAG: TolC family protein [Candidatus Melainabacteria bacterium]
MILSMISGLCFTPLSAWAGDPHEHHQPDHHQPIEHIELNVSKGLLPGLPVLDQAITMEEAVHLGLENNIGIDVAEAEVGIRKTLLQGAKAQRWPVLSVGSLTFLRGGNSQTLMTPDMMMNTVDSTLFQDLNATARVPLFTGGRIRGGISMARFSLQSSEAALKQTVVETAYQTKQAYLTALLSKAEHLVHQQHLTVQQILLKNTEVRYNVGRGLRADVLRIKTEMADAQKMLNEEHTRLNNAVYDLKAAMGLDMGSNIEVSETLDFSSWSGPVLDKLIQEAVANHPKVIEVQKQIQEAEAQIKIARSQYFPQVYGQATGNLRFPDRPDMMGNGIIGMATASLPVFDKNRGAEIAKAHASLKKTQQSLKALQLDISKQVAQAWSELAFAKENVALAEPAVAQSEENLRLIQKRYEAGRAVIVEVQDVAWQLRQAQLNRAEAIFNHELAKAKLLQAVGQVSEKP